MVLFNNDGCVIARSAEAKAVGIPMGKPASGCRGLFRRRDVAWTPREKRFMNRSRPIIP
jgi:DNA polymerase V